MRFAKSSALGLLFSTAAACSGTVDLTSSTGDAGAGGAGGTTTTTTGDTTSTSADGGSGGTATGGSGGTAGSPGGAAGSGGTGGAAACQTDADCPPMGCIQGTCFDGACYYGSCDADCDGVNGAMCGGPDCDDGDPDVPAAAEVCGNGKDDGCNGWTDAEDAACGQSNDTCADAIDVSAGGTFEGSTQGAAADYNFLGLLDVVYQFSTAGPVEAHVTTTVPSLPPGWMWPNDGVDFNHWVGPGCPPMVYNGYYCGGGGGAFCPPLPASTATCDRLGAGSYSIVVAAKTTQSNVGYPYQLDVDLVPRATPPCAALPDISAGGDFALDPLDPLWVDAMGACGAAGTKEAMFALHLLADTNVLLEGSERDGDLRVLPACDPDATPLDAFGKPFGYASEWCQGTLPPGDYVVVKELGTLKFGVPSASLHVTLAAPDAACAGAPVVTSTSSLPGSTAGAPSSIVVWTGHGLGPEKVYQLDLATKKRVVADLIPSYTGAIVYIERGCAKSQNSIFSTFDPQHRDVVLDPGTYYVVVDGEDPADAGDFVLNVTLLNPP